MCGWKPFARRTFDADEAAKHEREEHPPYGRRIGRLHYQRDGGQQPRHGLLSATWCVIRL
jgi:hypothetical protein